MLQCIGSRDEHLGAKGYCSGVCCTYAVKEAMLAKEHSKQGLDTAIFYIDMRTYGKDFERYTIGQEAKWVSVLSSQRSPTWRLWTTVGSPALRK